MRVSFKTASVSLELINLKAILGYCFPHREVQCHVLMLLGCLCVQLAQPLASQQHHGGLGPRGRMGGRAARGTRAGPVEQP